MTTTFFTITGMIFWAVMGLAILMTLFWFIYHHKELKLFSRNKKLSPQVIHLNPVEYVDWRQGGEANRYIQDFLDLGFQKIGSFTVQEIPMCLAAMVHANGLTANVCEYFPGCVWVEIIELYENGYWTKVSNFPEARSFARSEGIVRIFKEDYSAPQLFTLAMENRMKLPAIQITDKNFAREYEEMYFCDARNQPRHAPEAEGK